MSAGSVSPLLSMPSPLFDLEILPAGSGATQRILLGTLDGLFATDTDGAEPVRTGDFGPIRDLESLGPQQPAPLAVLEFADRLIWLDGSLNRVRELELRPGAQSLVVVEGAGVGVAAVSARKVVSGRFLDDDDHQVAIATPAGELWLLGVDSGELQFRARWSGIDELTSADFDGDGFDELVVAAGRRITVLERTRSGGSQTE